MCAGAIYWGNVGKVVYGISEKRLLELTGDDEQNPTLIYHVEKYSLEVKKI